MTAWAEDPGLTGATGTVTRTMQVPIVRYHDPFAATGEVPIVAYGDGRPQAPGWLRAAVWLVLLLILTGAAGLVIHQVRPSWLKSLERSAPGTVPSAAPASSSTSSSGRSSSGGITETTTGPGAADVTVPASRYTVVVAASNPCWVQVSTPASASAVFAQVMQAGDTQSFNSSQGKVTVQIGSVAASISVKANGKTLKWQFKPTAAPYVLNFTSTS